jgi:integrase
MAKRLTAIGVENAKPRAKRVEISDAGCKGLYLVIQPSGSKSWAVRYRFAGKPCKLTLGPALVLERGEAEPGEPAIDGALTLAAARKLAADALYKVKQGIEPATEKRSRIEAARDAATTRAADTVENLATQFVERYAKVKNRSWQQVEAIFRREILPQWKGRTVHEITTEHVEDLIDAIAADRPIMANRTLAALRKFFGWMGGRSKGGRKAVLKARLRTAPCLGVEAPGQERSRDRVLTNDEIKAIWCACDEEGEPFGPFLKALLLTGQRRGELAGMRRNEIDLDRREWSLPGTRTKNKKPHIVPLSHQAIQTIEAVTTMAGGYVFTTTGEGGVRAFSKVKRRIDRRINPVTPWVLHDIRRTVATGMADIGIQPHIVEAVLNHVSGHRAGVAGTYNRAIYASEKAEALQRWADHVEGLVSSKPANLATIGGHR